MDNDSKSKGKRDINNYSPIAGNLALDFANTLGGNRYGETREYLKSYSDLILWGKKVGILSEQNAKRYLQRATEMPGSATECLERGKILRESIYRVTSAATHKKKPSQEDLFLISREAITSLGRAKIVSDKNGFSWQWPESDINLESILWHISRAAADLLTSSNFAKVRECASDTCTWLFLDTSKNHTRRWCVMKDCGNRNKVRRYRQKT
jgi:predicted RNA-binding Zn ribbon-like protein